LPRNICLTLQYDGTDYHGWQFQPNAVTVQEVIELTLRRLIGHPVRLVGAGRTDAGVHAWGQVANFHTENSLPPEKLKKALNALLPPAIRVLASGEAAPDFDSRKMARSKTYRYYIFRRPEPSPWIFRYSWHLAIDLDAEAMNGAARSLVGKHDFSAFRASDCNAQTRIRSVSSFGIWAKKNLMIFEVAAEGFLKYMVRNMVGTLIEVGRGRLRPEEVQRILESGDRREAGPNIPARGLFLWKVDY
jgi:tRNA pseudouridine38-40 synthase